MNKRELLAAIGKNRARLILILLALAFAYWVWPTPWRYDQFRGTTARTNRFTGRVQVLTGSSWSSED